MEVQPDGVDADIRWIRFGDSISMPKKKRWLMTAIFSMGMIIQPYF